MSGKQILIVCRGNTCRSPMAAAILSQLMKQHGLSDLVCISSAGIWASNGQPATDEAQKTMRERGMDISHHRAHLLAPEDIDRADLIITMEANIAEIVTIEAPEASDKVYNLGELASDPIDVPDPIGKAIEEYYYTADLLQSLLQRAYKNILVHLSLPG